MKKYLIGSLLLLPILSNAARLGAQDVNDSDYHNYVVIIKKVPQLKPILTTAVALKAEDSDAFGDFQVVICRQEVKDITDP